MKRIRSIEIDDSSREEILPDFRPEFPYIATCAEMDWYYRRVTPWHWHGAVELFYMRSGTLEYATPGGNHVFPAGTGGFVNANVLHESRVVASGAETVQLLHLFDPALLSGERGSAMEEKYILPLTTAPGVEIIPLRPDREEEAEVLALIREAFALSEEEWGYEFRLRELLCGVWLKLMELARPSEDGAPGQGTDAQIKGLMVYIREHYPEPISVEELARTAHISKRACFRLFREKLHTTPLEYIRSCRLDAACRMLTKTRLSATEIALSCGLGSSSYFGKVFREVYGCTPMEYRRKWQDRDKI